MSESNPPKSMPRVVANGKPVESKVLPCSLEIFLSDLGFPPRSVVVELNGKAVAPSMFAQHTVQEGDRLEIVQIAAGG